MTIEKQTIVDLIETVKNGCVQVRACTFIMENGKQISSTFHRHVIVPGDDYSTEDAEVQAICSAVHTSEVVAAYRAMQETQIPA
jgi:hypothetical protein